MSATTEPGKPNGASKEAPEWLGWPTERAAARSLGLYPEQIRRITKKYKLEPFAAPDKTYRYPPIVFEQVVAVVKGPGVPEDEDDNEDDDTEAAPPRAKGAPSGKKTAESELTTALRLANEHNREMFKLTAAAQKDCLGILRDALKEQGTELTSLRSTAREATMAREAALNERQTRELMIEEQKRKDARWDTALATLTQAVQMLGAQAYETWEGWKKPTHVKGTELLVKLASKIATQLDLTPEEKAELLRVVEENMPKGTAAAAAPAPAAESSSAPAGGETGGGSTGDGGPAAPNAPPAAASPVPGGDASSGAGADASPAAASDEWSTSVPFRARGASKPSPGDASSGSSSDASSSSMSDAGTAAAASSAGPEGTAATAAGTAGSSGTAAPEPGTARSSGTAAAIAGTAPAGVDAGTAAPRPKLAKAKSRTRKKEGPHA